MPQSRQCDLREERQRSTQVGSLKGGREEGSTSKCFECWMNEGFVLPRSWSPRPPHPHFTQTLQIQAPLPRVIILLLWCVITEEEGNIWQKCSKIFGGYECSYKALVTSALPNSKGCSDNRYLLWCLMCVVADWCRGKRAIVMSCPFFSSSLPPFAQIFFEIVICPGEGGRSGEKAAVHSVPLPPSYLPFSPLLNFLWHPPLSLNSGKKAPAAT